MTPDFILYYAKNGTTDTKLSNKTQIIQWFQPKGEILFFKKPSDVLSVIIKTDKAVYAPGDTVNYEVNIVNKTTKKMIIDRSVMVSIVATDDSVFTKVE